jgi:hypothetical protein
MTTPPSECCLSARLVFSQTASCPASVMASQIGDLRFDVADHIATQPEIDESNH